MMRYMSCRNVMTLLHCLSSSFGVAQDFDQRPGLKFLMQKVARCDVATNLYKQMGVSRVFYTHALLEIVARQDNLHADNIKRMLATMQLNDTVINHVESDSSDGTPCASRVRDSAHTPVNGSEPGDSLTLLELASHSAAPVYKHIAVLTTMLKQALDDICTNYIDMYVERDGLNAADQLSRKLLVFLIAQDDVPSLRRDKSLRAMIEEKVKERSQKMVTSDVSGAPSVASSDTALAPVMTAAVQQQGQKCRLYCPYSDVTSHNYLHPA